MSWWWNTIWTTICAHQYFFSSSDPSFPDNPKWLCVTRDRLHRYKTRHKLQQTAVQPPLHLWGTFSKVTIQSCGNLQNKYIYIACNSYALSLPITLSVFFFVFFLSILMFLFLSTSHSAFWNFNGICACALQLAPKLWSKAKLILISTKGNLRRLCHNVHNQPVVVRGRHEVGSLPCPRRCHRPPGPRDVQGPEQAVNFCKKLVEEIYF